MELDNLRSLLGVAAIIAIAWLVSDNKRMIRWRVVVGGLALQLTFALFVLKTEPGIWIFQKIGDGVNHLVDFTQEGSRFLFGALAVKGGPMMTFAFAILPTVIFIGALTSVLYHLGIMQKVVGAMAWVMTRVMGVSGAESLCCAANVFVGQTEAPLVVKPYVATMTRSELMALMVGGFATIAGGVMVAYVSMGISAAHLLTASIMAAPAALLMAKLMIPETESPETLGTAKLKVEKTSANVIDAAAGGAADGVKLAINVAGMLLAFIALVAMLNFGFEAIGRIGDPDLATRLPGHPEKLSLGVILGWIFWPIAWLMGVPWNDVSAVASFLGTKISINEFLAYMNLSEKLPETFAAGQLSPRAAMIASYALCGFANFSSIAIQLGGIGSIAENRRHDLARLGLRAMLCGALVTCLTASLAASLVTRAESEFRHAEAIAVKHSEEAGRAADAAARDARLDAAPKLLREVAARNPGSKFAAKATEKARKLEEMIPLVKKGDKPLGELREIAAP